MNRFYYDLHIHSCLSPCADDDNTPNNLAGMAAVSGLDLIALTDHNSTKNCPAFFEAARRYNIIPIAGMELTTAEDIHMVCLFRTLDNAMRFGEMVDERRMPIKNRPDIFGDQLILDGEDNKIGEEKNLLSVATDISVDSLPDIIKDYCGICYPAHIDRDANGIIAVLGTLPPTPRFNVFELRDASNIQKYDERYGIGDRIKLINSDSHYLGTISDKVNYLELNAKRDDEDGVLDELFKLLR